MVMPFTVAAPGDRSHPAAAAPSAPTTSNARRRFTERALYRRAPAPDDSARRAPAAVGTRSTRSPVKASTASSSGRGGR